MKQYELVKYKYGMKPHVFTAFGIAIRAKSGKKTILRHFQSPDTAKAYLESIGGEIVDADWRELPLTGILRPLRSDSERRAPKQIIMRAA